MDLSISVIVPVYNVEKYLDQCLKSIVKQSVLFDEVILVNDGSTDLSLSICEKYVENYQYFKLINQKNRGLSAARNMGLRHASEEYVMFLDSDDYLDINTVKHLKYALGKFGYDAIYFDAFALYEVGFDFREDIYSRDLYYPGKNCMSGWEFFVDCYPQNYFVSVCMAVYKKKRIDKLKLMFPEGLFYEDNYFTFMFITQAENVTYLPKKLYNRRYRDNSITTSIYSERKFIDYIKVVLLIWDEIIKKKDTVLPKQKRLLLEFASDHCQVVLDNYKLCMEQDITLEDLGKSYFRSMAETYESLLDQYGIDNDIENLIIINKVLKNFQRIILYCPEYKAFANQRIKRTTKKRNHFYKQMLSELPLNIEKYKIGIYGTGKHTERMLELYGKLVGEIKCDLVFIDSYIESETYMDKNIINYKYIDGSFDLIIISSFLYRKEMIENVRKVNMKVPIHNFYKALKMDVFSEYK